MQAEFGNDAFDTAVADGQAGLAELLGDDGGGGLGIEEPLPDDLADDFVGASGTGLGTAFAAEQGRGATFELRLPASELRADALETVEQTA